MAEAIDRIDARVWRISMVVLIGSLMSILDTTIVNVALATLSRDLHSTISQIQWVVTGYLLALAAVIPVTGWAARRFGAKRVYLVSLVLFTGGSALCGLATSASELIVFRVLQGAGGGMLLPIGQLMMAEAAGPKRMGRVMSIVAVPMMLAPILGPTIGGLIVQNASWQWIFFVNVPIGVIAVIAALRTLPTVKPGKADKLDVRGLVLMSAGLALLTYGLAEIGSTGSFTATKVLFPCIIGLALVALFALHALRVPRPLLDLRLFKRPTFSSASIAMFFLAAALFGGMILLPLYWQDIRHQSVVDAGLLMAPQGIGAALSMPFAGRLSDRYGGGPIALIGVSITALMTIPFGLVGTHTPIWSLSIAMFIRGTGIGFGFMPAMTAAFASLKRSELSDATPQLNVLQRVGGSLGTAVLAVVLQRELAGAHTLTAQAAAYGVAFWASAALAAFAFIPCLFLLRAERAARAVQSPERIEESEEAAFAAEVAA
ncbi:MAG TPA: DHA2 family efflux MFS transporter permease subunit [Solirubrobacteraceae bacterium]|jgi:EmrB/QacA subfamily drug resistance transporter